MARQEQGRENTEDPKPPGHEEHAGVAEVGVEDGDLGHSDDGGAVGHRLGEQQPEVGLVVDGAEGVIDGRRHDGVDAGAAAVEESHEDAVPGLGPCCLLT